MFYVGHIVVALPRILISRDEAIKVYRKKLNLTKASIANAVNNVIF